MCCASWKLLQSKAPPTWGEGEDHNKAFTNSARTHTETTVRLLAAEVDPPVSPTPSQGSSLEDYRLPSLTTPPEAKTGTCASGTIPGGPPSGPTPKSLM
jgi:hypothetical protein